MLDDLNTPKALAELFSLAKQANISEDLSERTRLKAALIQSAEWLGLLQNDPQEWFSGGDSDIDIAQIDNLIVERNQAKQQKNWARADEIRDILADQNITLEDGENGTRWRIEK